MGDSAGGSLPEDKELLEVEDVATYLGVGNVTVHRWCRDGRLPCFKVGRLWRIRRRSLEDFMESREQPRTVPGRLRSFLEVPDNILAVAQSQGQMHRLDAAFFQVGLARGGTLVKYHSGPSGGGVEELLEGLESNGLEARELEEQGRLRLLCDSEEPGERLDQLGRLLSELEGEQRSIWVAFDWEERMDLEGALDQQRELTRFVEGSSLVVETAVLEDTLDGWPAGGERRAQLRHSGTVWLSDDGLLLSRTTSPDG